jgi:peptidoglycan hydrolase-like protein with peptidoglycan-binding domain
MLRHNSHGMMVGILQTMLSKLGLNIAIDQVFGDATEIAAKKFLQDHNLTVDGIVGQHTWGALAKATP